MNDSSTMILIGVGGAGSATARGVSRAYGEGLRYILADTDSTTGREGEPFTLIGGDRLSGHGSGGDFVSARLAAEESASALDEHLDGIRIAVVVTGLGGGTGSGATLEILKHLRDRGTPTVVFATTPFAFEGPTRQQTSRGVMSMIEDAANATFFIPLDKLVGGEDVMEEAFRHAVDTLASAITLFWRIVEKPGYIRTDAERLRHLIAGAGRGRFATVTVKGAKRAADAVESIVRSPLLTDGNGAVKSILCGVLSGDDLRLSEVGTVADGLRTAFGEQAAFELSTVNDEKTFSGRLSIVTMLFESATGDDAADPVRGRPARKQHKARSPLSVGPQGRGRFNNVEPTFWNGEDLDTPTFIRKNINLDL